VSYRLLASIVSFCLLSCAGSTQVHETVSRPHVESSLSESKPWPKEALKASGGTSTESEAKPQRRAKTTKTDVEEDAPQDFSGVDTSAPVDSDTDDGPRVVVVEGIEGTTSEFDVRTTLENRFEDFDRCHDLMGGGGGRIVYRIHIEANGDVGGVKVRTVKSRNRKLVDCYTEVVSTSHFPQPHGGYADVKWTTKVGRSGKRPNAMFERRHRWDTPAGSRAAK
jgi:hypothetical protein